MNLRQCSIDIEGTSLLDHNAIDYSSMPYKLKEEFKVHCVVLQDINTQEIFVLFEDPEGRSIDEMKKLVALEGKLDFKITYLEMKHLATVLSRCCRLIAHNGIGYDYPVLSLFLDKDYKVGGEGLAFDHECWEDRSTHLYDEWDGNKINLDDTLVLSKLLNPDRFGGHSLDEWGKRRGRHKVDIVEYTKKHLSLFLKGKELKEFEESVSTMQALKYKSALKTLYFSKLTPHMIYYCIIDAVLCTEVYKELQLERKGWDWEEAYNIECMVADIIAKQQHIGFKFDKELAQWCFKDLSIKLKEIENKVEPLLPLKCLTKKQIGDYSPPAKQVNQDLTISANMEKWLVKNTGFVSETEDKIIGVRVKKTLKIAKKVNIAGEVFDLPLEDKPIISGVKMSLRDHTALKEYIVTLGWEPLVWGETDLTLDSKKRKKTKESFLASVEDYLSKKRVSPFLKGVLEEVKVKSFNELVKKLENHKMDKPLKLPTSPKYTIDKDKTLDPGLDRLGSKVEFVKDVVAWLTYDHRRKFILSRAEDSATKKEDSGLLTHPRLAIDGVLPTPADTLGCNCVTGDTLIQTDSGLIPVTKVTVGDLVITHKGVYKPVIDYIPNGIKEVFRVTLQSGVEIKATGNHPFRVADKWVTVKNLSVGAKVSVYDGQEEWAGIPGFSKHKASSWGRIVDERGKDVTFKVGTSKLRRLPLYERRTCEILNDDREKKSHSVGYLILKAFVGDRLEGLEVCHRDGNPSNNHLKNLYYGTSKENSVDAKKHRKHLKSQNFRFKLSESQREEIKERLKEYNKGDDRRIAEEYGVSREIISRLRRGLDTFYPEEYKESFSTSEVFSIESIGYLPTYDITVDDHHSFVGNGTVLKNTSRMQHKVVANVPRSSSIYGEHMRALFGVDTEFDYQIGYDADGLEARDEAHYCWAFDEAKDYCNSLVREKPNDLHTLRAVKKGIDRNDSKSLKYGLTYGATPPRVAKLFGWPLDKAKEEVDSFWEDSLPLVSLKEYTVKAWKDQKSRSHGSFVKSIDGRKIFVRSEHSILNALFQSAGVISMKIAMIWADRELRKLDLIGDPFKEDIYKRPTTNQMIAYHDEGQNRVSRELVKFKMFKDKESAGKYKKEMTTSENILSDVSTVGGKIFVAESVVGSILARSVGAGGEYLNMNIDLTAGWQCGRNWGETH